MSKTPQVTEGKAAGEAIITACPFARPSIIDAPRIESGVPAQYRLVQRGTVLTLQGAFTWWQGDKAGYDWRDIPTVIEAATAATEPRV